jgi:hypothetical protein
MTGQPQQIVPKERETELGRLDRWLGLFLSLALIFAGCRAPPSPANPDAGALPDAGVTDGGLPHVQGGFDALFIGNSFTYVNDVPGHYRAIASAFSPAVRVEQVAPGGYTLAQHAADARTDGTALARWLRTGTPEETSFNAVVLQEQSQVGSFPNYLSDRIASIAAASELAALARARGAAVILYETWGYEQGDPTNEFINQTFLQMQTALDDAYRDLAALLREQGTEVRIAPVGGALRIVFEDVTLAGGDPLAKGSDFDALYEDDGKHPSLRAAYLAACVIAGTVAGADVRGFVDEPTLGPLLSSQLRDVCARALADPRWQVPETRRPDAALNGDPAHDRLFGRKVALSADGMRLLVGAYETAQVFGPGAAGWMEEARWPNTSLAEVALSGDGTRALVGSPWRVYVREGETWAEEATLPTSDFYASAALSGDGRRAIVYSGEPSAEVALAFARGDSAWTGDPLPGLDTFGGAVALDRDGTRALVRLKDSGLAGIFVRTDAGWTEETLLSSEQSRLPDTPAISADGTRALLLRPDHAALFVRSGGTWTEEATLWGPDSNLFGASVALSADGTRVVMGDPSDRPATSLSSPGGAQGSARVYELDSGALRPKFLLVPPHFDAVAIAYFGASVAISADGKTVAVGADGVATAGQYEVGAAYTFELP